MQGSKKSSKKSSVSSRTDNFILYEKEHLKTRYKRNKSWTTSMEEKLVSDIKKQWSADDWTIDDLSERLHEKVIFRKFRNG